MESYTPTKTDLIFDQTCPYKNPYQGVASRLLFVCTAGLLRSPTAADVATKKGYNARSCGSNIHMALIPISVNLILWADKIVFMDANNKLEAIQHFTTSSDEVKERLHEGAVWHIEDYYDRAESNLVRKCEEALDSLQIY